MGMRVVLLTAMNQEMQPLRRMLRLDLGEAIGRGTALRGRMGEVEVRAAVTSIGTEAARTVAEAMLDAFEPDHVLMVGIAGAVDPELGIGQLVRPAIVADDRTGAEFEVRGDGRGTLLTTDVLYNHPADIESLRTRDVVALDMETAAVAAVCDERSVDWSVFRAISDRAGDAKTDWSVVELAGPDGSPRPAKALGYVITHPQRIPQLVRLARGTNAAVATAARAAVDWLEKTGP